MFAFLRIRCILFILHHSCTAIPWQGIIHVLRIIIFPYYFLLMVIYYALCTQSSLIKKHGIVIYLHVFLKLNAAIRIWEVLNLFSIFTISIRTPLRHWLTVVDSIIIYTYFVNKHNDQIGTSPMPNMWWTPQAHYMPLLEL